MLAPQGSLSAPRAVEGIRPSCLRRAFARLCCAPVACSPSVDRTSSKTPLSPYLFPQPLDKQARILGKRRFKRQEDTRPVAGRAFPARLTTDSRRLLQLSGHGPPPTRSYTSADVWQRVSGGLTAVCHTLLPCVAQKQSRVWCRRPEGGTSGIYL